MSGVHYQVYDAVRTLITQNMTPFTKINNGTVPVNSGIAIAISGGGLSTAFLDRGQIQDIVFVLNAKHKDYRVVFTALSNIHMALTTMTNYPSGDGWQIANIETTAVPTFIEQEGSSKEWLFGSAFSVKISLGGNS